MTSLKGIQACVFDAYGTLFDVHSAVAQHSARLVDAAAVSTLWRTKQRLLKTPNWSIGSVL